MTVSADYSSSAINRRLAIYVAIAAFSTMAGSITDLASMTDAQVNAMSTFRWVVKIVLLLLTTVIAGLNAYRAAIDRSTGSTATDTQPADAPPSPPAVDPQFQTP